MEGKNIKIMSHNCQGLQMREKRRDIFNYLHSKDFDIYCLQDTHFVEQDETLIRNQWKGQCIFNSYASNQRGVAILFKNNFEYKIHQVKKDEDGNLLGLDINIEEKRFPLINVYGPNTDNPCFYDKVTQIIDFFIINCV